MKNPRISNLMKWVLAASLLSACAKSSESQDEIGPGGYSNSPTMAESKDAYAEESEGYAMADSISANYNAVSQTARITTSEGFISSSAAKMNPDSSKIFIRRADLRYEVMDVRSSTLQTEAVVGHFGGWVQNTQLRSEITQTDLTPVSEDSSLEVKHFTVVNDMTLRVPQGNLDTTLKTLSKMIVFLDHRNISVEDVGLKMQFEALKQKRNEQYNKRLGEKVDAKGNKLGSIVDAEAERARALERADNALMRQLEIKDEVQYSTIQLQIYQRETVRRTLVPNYKNIDAYRPGFFSRLWDALEDGWRGFLNLIIGLMVVWPLWVIIGGIIGTWIWIRKRRKKQG